MKRILFIFFILSFAFFIAGCNNENAVEWFDTQNEAIESGLAQEGSGLESVLSTEKFQGETFVFYESSSGLGTGNIIENNGTYSWKRTDPIVNFEVEGELPYSTAAFPFQTDSGISASILTGKAFDHTIQEMKLSGDGEERNLKLRGDNRFFYALIKVPYEDISLTPVQ
ncbi:hypothetical protein [Jeotgalibacillus aurantiacus]|uniref:hypothetical protein n=1 Tax=Jeotgalibacillus aurantiacus TaxID=2763266 RepID=UPI001D0AF0FD|nr:hypothetical protein [Jeotgalibacillus aurantiacus]